MFYHYYKIIMDKMFFFGIAIIAGCVVIAISFVFAFIMREASHVFYSEDGSVSKGIAELFLPAVDHDQNVAFLWRPSASTPQFNVIPLIVGTCKIAVIAMLVAAPLGILAALYTSHMLAKPFRKTLKLLLEFFAAIPSVVLGFFALMVVCDLFQDVFHLTYRLNALVTGVTLGIMIVPIIFTLSEEVLSSVPKSYLEASFSLGASKEKTLTRVVVPAAFPGICASLILAFSRALGETMIVLMISGNVALLSLNPLLPTTSISAVIASSITETVSGDSFYSVLFFLGFVLLLFSFVSNYVSEVLISFYKKRF